MASRCLMISVCMFSGGVLHATALQKTNVKSSLVRKEVIRSHAQSSTTFSSAVPAPVAVLSGSCTISGNQGECVQSEGYGTHNYPKNKACSFSMEGTITSSSLQTESNYDELTISGLGVFSGSAGPAAGTYVSGTHTWTSDYSIQSGGWKVCVEVSEVSESGDWSCMWQANADNTAAGIADMNPIAESVASKGECCDRCAATSGCTGAVYNTAEECYLKSGTPTLAVDSNGNSDTWACVAPAKVFKCATGPNNGCASCKEQQQLTVDNDCATCNPGYQLIGSMCQAYTCTTGAGSLCLTCKDPLNRTVDEDCASCNPGHRLSEDGSKCEAYTCATGTGAGCATCEELENRVAENDCATCNEGYRLVNETFCEIPPICTTGPGEFCKTCKDINDRFFDQHCESCNEGFTMFDGICKESCMTITQRDLLSTTRRRRGITDVDMAGIYTNVDASHKWCREDGKVIIRPGSLKPFKATRRDLEAWWWFPAKECEPISDVTVPLAHGDCTNLGCNAEKEIQPGTFKREDRHGELAPEGQHRAKDAVVSTEFTLSFGCSTDVLAKAQSQFLSNCMAKQLCFDQLSGTSLNPKWECACLWHTEPRWISDNSQCQEWQQCLAGKKSNFTTTLQDLLKAIAEDDDAEPEGEGEDDAQAAGGLVQTGDKGGAVQAPAGEELECVNPAIADIEELECECWSSSRAVCEAYAPESADAVQCWKSLMCTNSKVCSSWKTKKCKQEDTDWWVDNGPASSLLQKRKEKQSSKNRAASLDKSVGDKCVER